MIEVLIAPPQEKFNTNHDELGRFTFSSVGGGAIPQSGPVEAGVYKVWRAGQPDPDNPRGMWFAGGEEAQAKEFATTYVKDDRSVKQWNVNIENPLVVEGQIFTALSILENKSLRDIQRSRSNWMDRYRRENYSSGGIPLAGKQPDSVAWIRMADAKMHKKLKSQGYDSVIYRHDFPPGAIELGLPPWNADALVFEKYNPYHDELGRFTFAPGGAATVSEKRLLTPDDVSLATEDDLDELDRTLDEWRALTRQARKEQRDNPELVKTERARRFYEEATFVNNTIRWGKDNIRREAAENKIWIIRSSRGIEGVAITYTGKRGNNVYLDNLATSPRNLGSARHTSIYDPMHGVGTSLLITIGRHAVSLNKGIEGEALPGANNFYKALGAKPRVGRVYTIPPDAVRELVAAAEDF